MASPQLENPYAAPRSAPEPQSPRDRGGPTFSLRPWGRPLRSELGNLAQLGILVPVAALFASYPLIAWLGLPPKVALVMGSVLAAGLFGWVVWSDHRSHPAGALSLGGGRLHLTGWGGGVIDVSIAVLRRAVLVRYAGSRPAVLVLWLPWRRVYLHEPRLEGHRLEDVLAAIHEASARAGTGDELAAASSPAGFRRWQIRRAVIVIAIAVVIVGLARLAVT